AAGEIMEMAAHRPEKILRSGKARRFFFRQHALLDQLLDGVDAVNILRDPEEALQIAEAALALLDIGLDVIARIAELAVPLVALGTLRLDELGGAVATDLALEPPLQLVEELRVAPDIARFEQRGADGEVGTRMTQALFERARRVADLEPQIPQHVKH